MTDCTGWQKQLKFDDKGLIPAIVQDERTRDVLMLAYMNEDALRMTVETGKAHFWSRSRKKLWQKGETSGNCLMVKSIRFDCDMDALLLAVNPLGPACHTNNMSCFYREACVKPGSGGKVSLVESERAGDEDPGQSILDELYRVVQERKIDPPKRSYTASLMGSGKDRVLKKVGEEATEVVIASKNDSAEEIIYEMADLWFHTIVLLGYHDIPPGYVYRELRERRKGG